MKAWPSIGLLLLIGCSLDTAPDHTGSKPAAEEYPDWRPNMLDASVKDARGTKTTALSRDAGTHVDASPAKADTSAPVEPQHAAAGSGPMDSPSPPSAAAVIDAGAPSARPDAAVPVTMTMTAPAAPSPPQMTDDKGEHGRGEGQGEEHGNHGKGERADAGAPMTERPPAEGMHQAASASPAGAIGIVTSILDFVLGVVDGSVATQLVIDVLALAGAPNDAVVAATLTEGLKALDESRACRGRKADQCLATCELLSSDCHVCADDPSCLEALAKICGDDSVSACQ